MRLKFSEGPIFVRMNDKAYEGLFVAASKTATVHEGILLRNRNQQVIAVQNGCMLNVLG